MWSARQMNRPLEWCYQARIYWTMQKVRIDHPVMKFTPFSQTTRIPAEAREFSLQNRSGVLCGPLRLLVNGCGGSLRGLRWQQRDAGRTPPFTTKVKNEWGADNSLARPGRKQATATKLYPLQAAQKLFRRLSFQPGLRGSNDLRVWRKMATFQLFSQSGRAKDLPGPLYICFPLYVIMT